MRSRWLIVLLGVVFTVSAIAYALLATPYYRSSVLVSVVEYESESGGLSGLAGQLGGVSVIPGLSLSSGGSRTEYLAVLGSRQFAEDFISSNNLMPVLFSEFWDSQNEQWLKDKSDGEPTMEDAWELFNTEIRSIRIDGETKLVTLSIEWHDRELAAKWANEIIRRANEEIRQRAIADADKSLVFLNRELETTAILELQQGLYRMIEAKKQDQMLANVRKEFAFKILDPAVVSDSDREVRPKRAFLVIAGSLLGFMLGTLLALLRGYVLKPRQQST